MNGILKEYCKYCKKNELPKNSLENSSKCLDCKEKNKKNNKTYRIKKKTDKKDNLINDEQKELQALKKKIALQEKTISIEGAKESTVLKHLQKIGKCMTQCVDWLLVVMLKD